jgi:hypothetical protein
MRLVNLSLIPAVLAGFSIVAHADLQPGSDPEIAIDAGRFSSPINYGPCPMQPFPNAQGGGICDFVNDTGLTITELGFEDSVNVPGLPQGSALSAYLPPPASPTFTCDPAAFAPPPPGYYPFSTCLIYFQTPSGSPGLGLTTDEVSIFFFGGSGIAPGGHFEVNLNTDNSPTSNVGTWNTVDAGKFQTITINTTNGAFPRVPEPSMMWLLAAGCLLIFAARWIRSLNLQR